MSVLSDTKLPEIVDTLESFLRISFIPLAKKAQQCGKTRPIVDNNDVLTDRSQSSVDSTFDR